jgi:glycerophosphoryl diester phosphodiesterase
VKRWGAWKTRVESKKVEELRLLDAGAWRDAQFTGTKLPLLTEALDLIQSNGITLIERKAGDPATCVKLLKERGLINDVIVQAFDWEYLRGIHAIEPAQILGALGPPGTRDGQKLSDAEKKLNARWIKGVRKTGAQLVVWNKMLDRAAVETAHRQGLKVWVYTINDPATANSLLDLGIDGIITDNPAIIWRTLALRPIRRQ